jgi:hypothetical protein
MDGLKIDACFAAYMLLIHVLSDCAWSCLAEELREERIRLNKRVGVTSFGNATRNCRS